MHQVVPNVQAQLPRFRPDDGRAGHYVSSYDHPAMGAAARADFEKRWNQYARAVGDSWRVDGSGAKFKFRPDLAGESLAFS